MVGGIGGMHGMPKIHVPHRHDDYLIGQENLNHNKLLQNSNSSFDSRML